MRDGGLSCFEDMRKLHSVKGPLLPPLEHDDVPIQSFYALIVWLNLMNVAFATYERRCHPRQDRNAVSNFKFVHGR